jgi:hypothetical protein
VSDKRLFTELSTALKAAMPINPTGSGLFAWARSIGAVADVLGKHNRAFDRDRFLRDCGAVILPPGITGNRANTVIIDDAHPVARILSQNASRAGERTAASVAKLLGAPYGDTAPRPPHRIGCLNPHSCGLGNPCENCRPYHGEDCGK